MLPTDNRLGNEWAKLSEDTSRTWKEGVLYKQHPLRPGKAIPLDEFHNYITTEKVPCVCPQSPEENPQLCFQVKEFMDIMIGLGAQSIHYRKSKIMRGKEKIEVSGKKRYLPAARSRWK